MRTCLAGRRLRLPGVLLLFPGLCGTQLLVSFRSLLPLFPLALPLPCSVFAPTFLSLSSLNLLPQPPCHPYKTPLLMENVTPPTRLAVLPEQESLLLSRWQRRVLLHLRGVGHGLANQRGHLFGFKESRIAGCAALVGFLRPLVREDGLGAIYVQAAYPERWTQNTIRSMHSLIAGWLERSSMSGSRPRSLYGAVTQVSIHVANPSRDRAVGNAGMRRICFLLSLPDFDSQVQTAVLIVLKTKAPWPWKGLEHRCA
jgi:hypothetical protein